MKDWRSLGEFFAKQKILNLKTYTLQSYGPVGPNFLLIASIVYGSAFRESNSSCPQILFLL